MTVKVLTINIQISDQYGTSEDKLIGVFDDDHLLTESIEKLKKDYRNKRTMISVSEMILNVPFLDK